MIGCSQPIDSAAEQGSWLDLVFALPFETLKPRRLLLRFDPAHQLMFVNRFNY